MMISRINITDTEISFDDTVIQCPITYEQIYGLIGEPSRRTKLVNVILTYDNCGLDFHAKDDKQLSQVTIAYMPGGYNFSPLTAYPGEVYIRGTKIETTEDFTSVGSEDELDRNEEEGEGILRLELKNINCSIQFNPENRKLFDLIAYYK